jgi:hypothetical protein
VSAKLKKVAVTGDGAAIYLSSGSDSSDMLFAKPGEEVQREHFDGPVYQVKGNKCVQFESVHATGSTTVTVTDKGLLLHTMGFCSSCMGGDHDFDTWPTCPSGDRMRKQETDNSNAVPLRSKPVAERSSASSPSTNAQNGTDSADAAGAQNSAKASRRDGGPAPATGPVYALEYMDGRGGDRRGGDWTDLSETDGPAWG